MKVRSSKFEECLKARCRPRCPLAEVVSEGWQVGDGTKAYSAIKPEAGGGMCSWIIMREIIASDRLILIRTEEEDIRTRVQNIVNDLGDATSDRSCSMR